MGKEGGGGAEGDGVEGKDAMTMYEKEGHCRVAAHSVAGSRISLKSCQRVELAKDQPNSSDSC